MTILFTACVPVKPRKPFGVGIARPARERRTPYTAADAQWWAENSPANAVGYEVAGPSDAEIDRMARESEELDSVCRGFLPC